MLGNWVDLVIIVIIAFSVITGAVRGFVKELIALCVWVLASYVAYNYSQRIDPWLLPYVHDKTARTVTAFILVFVATLLLGGILNACLGAVMKHTGLSATDRLLGFGFGFLRGVFIVALILLVIEMTGMPHKSYSKDSNLYAKFDPLVTWLYDLSPTFIKKAKIFDKQTSALNNELDDFSLSTT